LPTLNPKIIKVSSETKQKRMSIALAEQDDVVVERKEDLLKKELRRPRPQVEVVKSLVQRTLLSRRIAVLDYDRPKDLLDKYPHLRKPCTIIQCVRMYVVCVWEEMRDEGELFVLRIVLS